MNPLIFQVCKIILDDTRLLNKLNSELTTKTEAWVFSMAVKKCVDTVFATAECVRLETIHVFKNCSPHDIPMYLFIL